MFLGAADKKNDPVALKKGGGSKPFLNQAQKRKLLIYSVVLLMIIAMPLLLLSGGSRGLASCEGIILSQQRYECISGLASSTSNASMCSNLPSQYSYNCVLGIALHNKNLTECGIINPSSPYYYSCVYNITVSLGSPSGCHLLQGAQESTCLYSIAQLSNFTDLALCASIPSKSTEAQCSYMYYFRNAISYGNAGSCAALPSSVNYGLMLNMSKYVANQSIGSVFEYALGKFTPRDYCYNQVAILEKNATICSFASPDAANFCQYQVQYAIEAAVNNTAVNTSVSCANLPLSKLTQAENLTKNETRYLYNLTIFGCTMESAITAKNITICSEIQNSTYYNSCVWGYIKNFNATGYCNDLTNSSLKDYCYSGYA